MKSRVTNGGVVIAAILAACWTAGVHTAQRGQRASTQAAQNVATPRTADGHPDLTDLWVQSFC